MKGRGVRAVEVKKVEDFKYPRSTVQSNGECRKEAKRHVQADWTGKVSGVCCVTKKGQRK